MKAKNFIKYNLLNIQLICQVFLPILLLIFVTIAITGCSKRYSDLPAYSPIPIKYTNNNTIGRFKTTYLVEQIDSFYNGIDPGPIGVATFVNLDDLYTTSSFGRVLAEQVISELAMKGYTVVELRLADALRYLSNEGEFILSRDTNAIRKHHDLGGVIVGTYLASPVRVYINARLINPSTATILSAGSVEVLKTKEIAKLLKGGNITPVLERIPVKHLGINQYPLYMFPSKSIAYEREEMLNNTPKPLKSPIQPLFPHSKKDH